MGKKIVQTIGILTIIFTLFRFVASDFWWIRVFDFPHIQITIFTAFAFVIYFYKFKVSNYKDYIFSFLLLVCAVYQFYKIYSFTPLAPYEILDATSVEDDKTISFYTANVLQKNKKKEALINEVKGIDADILLFTETNSAWQNRITEGLDSSYKYRVEHPLDNTYGMLMYSKLELINPEVKIQVQDSIPSIYTKVKLSSGDTIQVIAIHPTPPMPQHNPKSTERDAEMMITGMCAKDSQYPVIVIGDFNDVAWSQTTMLFQRISGLLDPRKGRGLFNTFNAKNFLMRWPLDHVFVSPEFRVISIEREEKINSDHFPIYAKFSLKPEGASVQKLKPPTESELSNARDQIKKLKKHKKD